MTSVDTELPTSPAAIAEQALHGVAAEPAATRFDEAIVDGIRQLQSIARLADAASVQLIAEAQRRNLPTQHGARTTSAWLQHLLRLTPSEAKTRLIAAEGVQERTALSGEPLPSQLPDGAEALAQGSIGLEHVRVIADGLQALPPSVDDEVRQQAETMLVEHARTLAPDKLRILANRIRYHFDQDGALRDEEYQHERRELQMATARDGMTVLKARFDKETGAKLHAVLQPLAAPRPATNGERDPRSAGTRNADAFDALLDIALANDQVPTTGGQRAHLAVTIGYETLRASVDGQDFNGTVLGSGTLDNTGEPISAAAARRLACDSNVLPIVLGSSSEPLDVGRMRYTVPPPMRQALLARDGVCSFPGCDRPPGTSQAHHAKHWADGGETSVDNLTMLCGEHHRRVHAEGWQVRIRDGYPVFIPPRTIDPTQTPRAGQGRDPTNFDLVR